MAHPRRPAPRRLVRYTVGDDALGPFIAFSLDEVILPGNVPPHKLPSDTKLEWRRLACRFTPGDPNIPPRKLQELFLEFAEKMYWEAQRDS